MRWIVLALVLGCGGPKGRGTPETTEPTGTFFTDKGGPATDRRFREGPGGFPIPADAINCKELPNKDLGCNVPRKRDVVHAELVEYLKTKGMVVEAQQELAGGLRMQIKSATASYLVSVTTDTATTSIMMITVK